jgi:hypothetical protein
MPTGRTPDPETSTDRMADAAVRSRGRALSALSIWWIVNGSFAVPASSTNKSVVLAFLPDRVQLRRLDYAG